MDREQTIGDSLLAYYREHALPPDGGESLAWFRVRLGRLSLLIPNPPARRKAIFFHDVNHILTGYNTTFSEGEMDIAGFEIGAGCGRYVVAWVINAFMFGLGLLIRPRSVLRAFRRGRRSRSLYRDARDRATLRTTTLSQLRNELGLSHESSP